MDEPERVPKTYRVSLLAGAGSMDLGPEVQWEWDKANKEWVMARNKNGSPKLTGRGPLRLVGAVAVEVHEAYANYLAGTQQVRVILVTEEEKAMREQDVQKASDAAPLTVGQLRELLANPEALAALQGTLGIAPQTLRGSRTESKPTPATNKDVLDVAEPVAARK